MNKNLAKRIAVGAGLAAVMLPLAAMAQLSADDLGLVDAGAEIGLTDRDIRETVGSIIKAFMGLLGIVAVVIILLGGFKWMMSQGESAKVDDAKKLMMSGVIGLAIILTSYAIATFVIDALVNATGGNTLPPPEIEG